MFVCQCVVGPIRRCLCRNEPQGTSERSIEWHAHSPSAWTVCLLTADKYVSLFEWRESCLMTVKMLSQKFQKA